MYLSEGKIGGSYHVKDIKLPTNMEKETGGFGHDPRHLGSRSETAKSQGVLIIKIRGTRFALGRNITKKYFSGGETDEKRILQ